MFTCRQITLSTVQPDENGYHEVFLGKLEPEQVALVNEILARKTVSYALLKESFMGLWADNNLSAANYKTGYHDPAFSVREIKADERGLTAYVKPIGTQHDKLRKRLVESSGVAFTAIVGEGGIGLFVTSW